ncbi:hypothetical protein fHeYen902_047c [Yersinia phage fHe-Yen9-02]|nr:hypothetical protein fHeYen902_047c [Yersinia phage fHe-Yen9-02]
MIGLSVNGDVKYRLIQPSEVIRCVVQITETIPANAILKIEKADNTVVAQFSGTIEQYNQLDVSLPSGESDIRATLFNGDGVTRIFSSALMRVSRLSLNEISPRFGIHEKVLSAAGYDAAFFSSLTTSLTDTGEQFVTCPANTSTDQNRMYFYVMWPKRLGYGYFRDYTSGSYGFAGSWDGAEDFDDFTYSGPCEIDIAGVPHVIYRNDFPFGVNNYVFSILYGSTTPKSGEV